MGAKCFRGRGESVESVHGSVISLSDLQEQATDLEEMTLEETRDDAGPSEEFLPIPTVRPSDVVEMLETSTNESPQNLGQDEASSCYRASNILWSTGSFSDPIPNGFYSVIPDNRLKLFKSIPTLDEINALGDERVKADVILIDFESDQKIGMLQDLIILLVKGLNSKPAKAIKKIAALVADVYKRTPLQSPATPSFESHGFPLLGGIKHGSCRARAIFFKILADTVGLKSRLVVGFPSFMSSCASVDSYNHMSVVVVLNDVELLVDLTRSPGQLIPFTPKAIYMAHISVARETDYPYNDYCDSPLDPNTPMHGNMARIDHASLSRSEPNIASELRRRKVNKEQRTDIFRTSDEAATKKRRSNHMKAHDISNDIAREAQVMRQSRFLEKRGDGSSPHSPGDKNVSGFHHDSHDQVYGGRSRIDPQKAIALMSSPRNYLNQSSERSGLSRQRMGHIYNEVLESPMFPNKPLLPCKEWNIDFSKLTVGARVGYGSFGVVFRGMRNETVVAIKKLHKQQLTAEIMEDFCNEISILSRLRHPNVVLFLGACTKPPHLSVVTEYMERGSLYDVLRTRKEKLRWVIILKMLRDICRGLMYIHQMRIVHCDLKSGNCLLSKNGTVKICDFGLSRIMKGTTVKDGGAAGTPEWVAPELIRSEPFSEKCDIFSLGVIMWEFCTLSTPWEGVPKAKVVHIVANGARLEIPEGPLSKLIADCWLEQEQRPSCEEILHRLSICEFPDD